MVNLYKNYTPNANGDYDFFVDENAYLSTIASKLVKSYQESNYRLNSEICEIKLDEDFTEADAKLITYIIENRDGVRRNYHVNRYFCQSGYAKFFLSLDNWGTYIDKAKIEAEVVKCNRKIADGFYDEPAPTYARSEKYLPIPSMTSGTSNQFLDVAQTCIVFTIKYNVYSTPTGAVSTTKTFMANLEAIKRAFVDGGADATQKLNRSVVNAVDLAVSVIGGIHGIKSTNGWGITSENSAEVLGAWLCITGMVIPNTIGTYEFNSTNEYTGQWTLTGLVNEVVYYRSSRQFDLGALDPDYAYYFGTQASNLKLARMTNEHVYARLDFITGLTGLKVIAVQGDNQEDVTSAFAIDITTTAGDVSAQRLILHSLGIALKASASVVGIMTGKDALKIAGALGLMKTGMDVLDPQYERGQGSTINGGDGVTSFRNIASGTPDDIDANISWPVKNPFMLISYRSNTDELARVRRYGANFAKMITSLNEIFESDFLVPNSTYTFVKANCNVSEIPLNASNEISNALQNGIRLIKYA